MTNDRFGNLNSAYDFNGIDNYIVFSASNLTFPTYSFSAWIQSKSTTSSAQPILSLGSPRANQAIALTNSDQTDGSQKLSFFSYTDQNEDLYPNISF